MTSLKKPLIAIASAVALATTALVVSPANAAISADVEVNNVNITATATVADPILVPVPADNYVSVDQAVELNFVVAANTVVSATATNAKLIAVLDDASGTRVTSASGAATYSVNSGTGTAVTFYAFTTKAAAGSVSVTIGGDTVTYNLKGTAGSAYNLSVVAPATAGLGVNADITATVTDVFGNSVENAAITTSVLRGTVHTALTWDATDKRYEGKITTPTVAGTVPAVATISATDVEGLAKAVKEVSFTINAADLAGQVTALTAELATAKADLVKAQADLAALKAAEIKKYNTLATKWNKKFPKSKVALRK